MIVALPWIGMVIATVIAVNVCRVNGANATVNAMVIAIRDRGEESNIVQLRGSKSVAKRIEDLSPENGTKLDQVTVYAYGVARNRLFQAARRLHVPLIVADDAGQADAILTLKNYYRRRPKLIVDAERRGIPIYVLRANTVSQMENFIVDLFHLEVPQSQDPFGEALRETEVAIMKIRAGADYIDLTPQASHIRRKQHQMARKSQLVSKSTAKNQNVMSGFSA